MVGDSAWIAYRAGAARLALTGQAPWRLLDFLDDAHRRGVLRRSGTVYEFRHRSVRRYLAHPAQAALTDAEVIQAALGPDTSERPARRFRAAERDLRAAVMHVPQARTPSACPPDGCRTRVACRCSPGPLANGDRAVALLNTTTTTATIATTLTAVGLPAASATVTDLWSGAVTTTTTAISASVPAHGTAMFRVHSSGTVAAGATEIVGRASGLCLDVRGGAATDGAPLIIWDCHGGANQQFAHNGALSTVGGAKCLRPRATTNGSAVETGPCDGSPAQRFTRTPTGTLRHDASGRCLDVFNAQTTKDSPVILWDCHSGSNQQWWRQ